MKISSFWKKIEYHKQNDATLAEKSKLDVERICTKRNSPFS